MPSLILLLRTFLKPYLDIAVSFHLHLDTEHVQHVDFDQPICVEPSTAISEVFGLLRDSELGSVLVCESGKLAGVFTERDALRLLADDADVTQPIATQMTSEPVTTAATETVAEAIQKMAVGGYRRLPVVDEANAAVGLLRVEHILRYLVEHFPEAVYNLPPTTKHSMQSREGA